MSTTPGLAAETPSASTNGHLRAVPPPQDLWTARPAFAHIQHFAYSRMCSPWAVLGMSLLHALHWIPPWIKLPAIIGSVGSLNSFVALVGPSGSGKGAAEACAADAFDMNRTALQPVSLGSGEGIVHQYARWEGTVQKGECVQHTNQVLFTVPEVDQLASLKMRNGSTLLSQLRNAWMGEQLGFAYSNTEKRVMVGRHKYRFGLTVGVQPLRAAVLLDDVDAGTPQRFLWLPSADPGITADVPESPPPMILRVTQDSWPNQILKVPVEAERAIRENRAAQNRGENVALDGHALFARLKAAQAIAILDDRREMNLEDWELAGLIMAKSDQTRAMVVAELRRKEHEVETARALSAGRSDVIRGRVADDEGLQKACGAILRKLQRERDWVPGKTARQAVPYKYREHFDDAVDKLTETGQIEVEQVSYRDQKGIRLRARA